MNPETNKFEPTQEDNDNYKLLQKAIGGLRPNGEPVPKHWSIFTVGELITIKDYTFKVAYIGETNILFEPVSPAAIGE